MPPCPEWLRQELQDSIAFQRQLIGDMNLAHNRGADNRAICCRDPRDGKPLSREELLERHTVGLMVIMELELRTRVDATRSYLVPGSIG